MGSVHVCCLYHHLKDCFTYLPHYQDSTTIRPHITAATGKPVQESTGADLYEH